MRALSNLLARWGFMGPPRMIDTRYRVWHIPGRDDAEIIRHLLELASYPSSCSTQGGGEW
jgi:hypothetical protein